ncbi:MAG: DUF2184 domain-containing protein [Oxalobacter formigenes]|nr:DUF2184 domain-containing protein [Oxalobacter formigenes]
MNQPTLQEVAKLGFHFPYSKGWLNKQMAMDSALVTTPNTAIPANLLGYISPEVIPVLTAKQAASQIFDEKKYGDWQNAYIQFRTREYTGSTGPYSDYGDGPSSGVNENYNTRERYIFQTTITYGDLEVDMSALAKVDLIADKQRGAAEVIRLDSNKFYLLGVAGKKIYGLLNDPNLPPAITPNVVNGAISWPDKLSMENDFGTRAVYNDFLKLFAQLQTQAKGLIDNSAPLRLLVSPERAVMLSMATNFNISATEMLKTNFPNLEIITVPQLSSATAGESMVLLVKSFMGTDTADLAFGEKIRQGRLVADTSNFRQKFSATTYGALVKIPFAFAVMSGI